MCDEIVRDAGLTPSNDGPNDGGTVTLKKQDGDVTLYSVGFAKDQMVIFTTTGGLSSVTTFPKLVELAGGQLLAPGRGPHVIGAHESGDLDLHVARPGRTLDRQGRVRTQYPPDAQSDGVATAQVFPDRRGCALRLKRANCAQRAPARREPVRASHLETRPQTPKPVPHPPGSRRARRWGCGSHGRPRRHSPVLDLVPRPGTKTSRSRVPSILRFAPTFGACDEWDRYESLSNLRWCGE